MRGAAGAGGAAAGEFQNWKETTEAAVRMERRLDSLTGEIDSHGRPVGLGGARAELTKGLEMIERVRKRQAAVFRRLKPYKLTHPLKFMSLGSKSAKTSMQLCDGSTREFMRLKLLKDMQPGLYKNNTFWMKRMKTYWHYHDPVLLMYEEKIMNTDKRKVAPLMARLTRDVRKFAAKIVQFRDMIATFEQSMMATTHAMNDLIASPEGSTFAAEKSKIECEIRNAHHGIATYEENTAALIEEAQALQSELRDIQENVVVDEYLPFGKDIETLKEDETKLGFEHEETLQRLRMFEDLLTTGFKSMREDLRKLRVNWQENGELHKSAPALAEIVTSLKQSRLEVLQKYIGAPLSRDTIKNLLMNESNFVTSLMKRMDKHFPSI
jgi:predicted  nucleic acid-binding Zn-ribbon protein